MPTPSDAQLLERLARIERSIAILNDELRQVRASLGERAAAVDEAPAPAPGGPPPLPRFVTAGPARSESRSPVESAPLRPQPESRAPHAKATWTADEVEEVAGRYGMLALATVTGLAAVGTFLGWAIAQGLLGPRVRVGLGLLLAAALAGTGAWLRPRERSFGAALLGIALAVVHVCGWAVSPANLNLVPAAVALGATVLASVALALFAHREDDEPLWCTGFGGAAIAPFVTSSEGGSALMLATYGLVVLLLGSWALRQRAWPIAGRVLTASAALFAGALLAAPHHTGSPLMALGLAMAVAGAGVLPFASPEMRRGRLRMLGALAAIAAFAAADSGSLPVTGATLAAVIAVAGLAWLAIVDRTATLPTGSLLDGLLGDGADFWDWIDAAIIPLGFTGAMLVAVDAGATPRLIAAAGAAVACGVLVARRAAGPLRDAAVFALCCAALVAASTELVEQQRVAVIALAAIGFVAANRWRPATTWVPIAGITLCFTSVGAYALLSNRPAYEYLPFLTHPSAMAAFVALGWFASARLAPAPVQQPDWMAILAWTWAFFWVHQELVEALSPTTSTLLIISYYAATSVAAVWVGRTRGIPALRHLGLVFALVAAASAARGAARLDEVWARVAGYLVTSAFLLALAWWYRRRSGPSAASTAV